MHPKVLLTGCCGYLGARITLDLLRAGFRVRGTSKEPAYARALFAEAFETHRVDEDARARLEIVPGELLDAASWRGASDGCTTVIHTALPVVTSVGAPRTELLDAALIGTENVVREAARAGSVDRFLHMSSVVTLLDQHAHGARTRPHERLGPEHWNETATAESDPYAFAKVRGERRARALVSEFLPGASFASVLPGAVIGPPIGGSRVPASIDKTLSPFLGGRMKTGSVDLPLALVDARDVAAVFVELARRPAERGRFICVARPVPRMQDVADSLRAAFPAYDRQLPRRTIALPRALLLPVMRMMLGDEEYSYARAMLGRPLDYDTSLVERIGVRFRPLRDSITDTVAWLRARTAFA